LPSLENCDVSLFSCEGNETKGANPQFLEQYVNAGGRGFLSHYHDAWLAGPLETGASAGYTANADHSTPGRCGAKPHLYVQAGHGAPDSTYDSTARAELLAVRTPRKNK
jgi:hypothetical protein